MRKIFIILIFLATVFLITKNNSNILNETEKAVSLKQEDYREVSGIIKKGETLFDIFKKDTLDIGELFELREAKEVPSNIKNLQAAPWA